MIRKIVLDVVKPHTPLIVDMAVELSKMKYIDGVHIRIYNREPRVENVKITIEGKHLEFEKINKVLDQLGASIQSVDGVCVGKIVEEPCYS